MTDIARFLDLDKSSVTGLVDRAERGGLVRRISSDEDGRSIRVALTPAGRKLAATMTKEVSRRIAEVTAGLEARESEQLRTLASRVLRS